jgi:ankyrin repeat protein
MAQNLSAVVRDLVSDIDRWSNQNASPSPSAATSRANASTVASTAATDATSSTVGPRPGLAHTTDDSAAENQVEYAANMESKMLDMDDASSGLFEHLNVKSEVRELLISPAVDSTLKHMQASAVDVASGASGALAATGIVGTVLSNAAGSACRTVVQGLMHVATCVPLFGKLFQLGLDVFRQLDEYGEMQCVFEKLCKSMYSGLRLLQLLAAAVSTSQSQADTLQTLQTFRTALVRLLDILALIERIEDASTFRKFIQSSDMRRDIVDASSAFRNDVQDVLVQAQTGVLGRLTAVEQQVEHNALRTDAVEQKLTSNFKASADAVSALQKQVNQQRKQLRGIAVVSAMYSTNAHHCWQQVVRGVTHAARHGGVLGIPHETKTRMQVHVPLQVAVTDRDTAEQFAADALFQRASTGCVTRNTLFEDADDKYLRNAPDNVRVFLLQGRAGSGKTHTGWHVWQQAALQCDERVLMDCKSPPDDCLVPLFISLNHFRDAALGGTLMQAYFEYFDGLGTTPDVAVESLRTYGRFLIILDGLDELADKDTNVYMKNELYRWSHSVVCISSRTGFLSSVNRGIETLIAPVSVMNNAPQMSQVQQLYVRPFNDTQRSEFIRKFCSAAVGDGKAMSNTDIAEVVAQYQMHLAQLQDMQNLSSSPLTLFMLLDVLPHMHQNLGHLRTTSSMTSLSTAPTFLRTSSSVDADVTVLQHEAQEKPLRLDTKELELSRNSTCVFPQLRQVEVYAVFLHHWLQRETDRLVNAGTLKREDQLAVIGEAEDFCAKLAFEMFLHDRTSIEWRGPRMSAQSDSKTQKLSRRQRRRLQRQPSLASIVPHSIMQLLTETQQQHDGLAFAASPLVRSGSSYSFLHKSIRDYLAAYHVCSQVMDACLDDDADGMAWSDRLQRVDAIGELMLSKRCLTADYAVLSFAGELVDQRYTLSHPYRASWPVASWDDFCDARSEHASSVSTAALTEPSSRQPLLKALFDVVEASKHASCTDGDIADDAGVHASLVRIAAANAISMLNAANICFSGMDFSGIQIGRVAGAGPLPAYPAADLYGALLYGADLSGANLSHVRLECASLNDSKLKGSVLDHALLGQRPKISTQHTEYLLEVVYDRARDWLITTSYDSTIRVTHASSGDCIAVLEWYKGCVNSLSYDADSGILASANDDMTVRIWDVVQAECIQVLGNDSDCRVLCVAFDASSHTVVSGSSGGIVSIFDSVSGKRRHVLQSPESLAIFSVCYDASGRTIFAGNEKGKVLIWCMAGASINDSIASDDVAVSASYSDPISFDAHASACIRSIAFDHDHSLLLAASDNGSVRIWDVSNGFDNIGQPLQSCTGHSDRCTNMSYDRVSQRLVTSSRDGTVRLWDSCSGECISSIHTGSKVNNAVWFDADTEVVYAAVEKHVQVWDISVSGRLSKTSRSSSSPVTALFLDDKSCLVAAGDLDGCVYAWDLRSGQLIHSFANHDFAVSAVCIDPLSQYVVSASCDGTFCIRDLHELDTENHVLVSIPDTSHADGQKQDWIRTLRFNQLATSDQYTSRAVAAWTMDGAVLQWDFMHRCWVDCDASTNTPDDASSSTSHARNDDEQMFPVGECTNTLSVNGHGHGVKVLQHGSYSSGTERNGYCTLWSSDPYMLSHNNKDVLSGVVSDADFYRTDWNSALLAACEQNARNRVAFLIRQVKCDPNNAGTDGSTPVCIASRKGHVDIVRYLVAEAKCDPNQANNDGNTPLYVASEHGHLDIVRYLVAEAECDPNQANNDGTAPVYIASANRHLEIVRYLVGECKCDPNQANNDGTSPVYIASYQGHVDIVRYLVGEGKCDPNQAPNTGITPLCIASGNGHWDVVRYLVDEGKCDPNQADNDGITPVYIASKMGLWDIVRYLVDEGKCDANQADNSGITPVCIASQQGHLDIVRYLVTEGKCDPNQANNLGFTPVYLASQNGHLDIVRYLVTEVKCAPNQVRFDGTTAVWIASQRGHLDIVRYLVTESKCDPNQANNDGVTPVCIASAKGHLDIVRYLVTEVKCNPNQTDNNYGVVPVTIASHCGHLDIVRVLVDECSCDINIVDNHGDSPVLCAASQGHLDVVQFLVASGNCDALQRNKQGRSPLWCACQNGRFDIVRYLVTEAKCDPFQGSNDGTATIDIANQNGHHDIVEYLTEQCNMALQCKHGPMHAKCCIIL